MDSRTFVDMNTSSDDEVLRALYGIGDDDMGFRGDARDPSGALAEVVSPSGALVSITRTSLGRSSYGGTSLASGKGKLERTTTDPAVVAYCLAYLRGVAPYVFGTAMNLTQVSGVDSYGHSYSHRLVDDQYSLRTMRVLTSGGPGADDPSLREVRDLYIGSLRKWANDYAGTDVSRYQRIAEAIVEFCRIARGYTETGVAPAGDVVDDLDPGGRDIFGDGRVASSSAAAAAANLIDYVAMRLSTLTPTTFDATVQRYQTQMGSITADGKYGGSTRARIRELLGPAVVIPDLAGARPSPTATAAPASSGRRPRTLAEWEAVQNLGIPQGAAVGLWGYVERNRARLRSDVPDNNVRSYQSQMGGLSADGKYGRNTRGKIASLLPGVTPPELPSSTSSPIVTPPRTTAAPPPQTTAAPLSDYPGSRPPPTLPPRPTQAPQRSWLQRLWDAF